MSYVTFGLVMQRSSLRQGSLLVLVYSTYVINFDPLDSGYYD